MRQQIGRLALRVEGNWWVAYYALPDSMKGAVEMARIKMSIVQDQQRKQVFMDLCRSYISEMLKDGFGKAPEGWEIQLAPEHERSGSA